MTNKLNRGGLVVGHSHAEGGVDFVIEDTGKHVEMEGEEAVIPIEISNDTKEYEFSGTNYEILNQILKKANLSLSKKVTSVKSGDIVICIKSTWDDEKRTIKGTIRQVLSAINESRGCKKIEDGAEVESDHEGGEEKKKDGGKVSGKSKSGSCPFWDFYKTQLSDEQKKLIPHPKVFDLGDEEKNKNRKKHKEPKSFLWMKDNGYLDFGNKKSIDDEKIYASDEKRNHISSSIEGFPFEENTKTHSDIQRNKSISQTENFETKGSLHTEIRNHFQGHWGFARDPRVNEAAKCVDKKNESKRLQHAVLVGENEKIENGGDVNEMLYGGLVEGVNNKKFRLAQHMRGFGLAHRKGAAKDAWDREIWEQTGWYFNERDSMWRNEISDEGYRWKLSIDQIYSEYFLKKRAIRIDNLIDHKLLFQLVPEIRKTFVIFNECKDEETICGSHNNGNKFTLFINFKYYKQHGKEKKTSDLLSSSAILLAELQHYLQRRFRFARDYGVEGALQQINQKIDSEGVRLRTSLEKGDLEGAEKHTQNITDLQSNKHEQAQLDYVMQLGEVESRDVAYRMKFNEQTRKKNYPLSVSVNKQGIDDKKIKVQFGDGGDIKKSPEELAKEFLDKLSSDDYSKIREEMQDAMNELLVREQKKLNDLVAEKTSIDKKRTEERNTLETEARMHLSRESEKLGLTITNQENVIIALKNNGDTISFDDKKGTSHKGIPYFSKINTNMISFDEETILTDAAPTYVPKINEEAFRQKGYVFDVIRISPDEYLLAVNGYKEKVGGSYSYKTNAEEGGYHPSDAEQGYVIVTLDQLALINDYYFTKAKATNQKEADDKSKRQETWYDNLPESQRATHLNQPNYYRSLPVSVKKKVAEEKWNTLTLQEKEFFYKPFKRYGAKRITSKLEDDQMWVSFHGMYERFVDPEAKEEKGRGLYKWVDKGFISKESVDLAVKERPNHFFGHPEIFAYWKSFRDMMKWKILDIGVQRIVQSEVRKTALETSFGESNTNDALKAEYGILVKRQDGSQVNPIEIEQLKKAWVNVNNVYGNLSVQAKDTSLKLSHTGMKYVYASKSVGMYIPDMGTIAVSAKFGENQLESTLAHESAHWIDNQIGKQKGKRYASDDFESTAGLVASTFRKHLNQRSDSKYVNATCECFARAFEQYFAIETFGDDATLLFSFSPFGKERKYFEEEDYVSKSNYEEKIKPLIKQFFEEHKMFFKYDVDVEKKNYGGILGARNIPSEIFTDTEGRDRFIIDDKASEIDINVIIETARSASMRDEIITKKLKSILTKWDGYDNYPNLRELNVIFSKRFGGEFDLSLMGYSEFNDSIYINVQQILKTITNATLSQYRRLSRPEGKVERPELGRPDGFSEHGSGFGRILRGRIFRELQHAIQRREGIRMVSFNEKDILKDLKSIHWKSEMPDEEFKVWISEKEGKPYLKIRNDFFQNHFSQIEARDVEKRVNLSKEEQEIYVPVITKH